MRWASPPERVVADVAEVGHSRGRLQRAWKAFAESAECFREALALRKIGRLRIVADGVILVTDGERFGIVAGRPAADFTGDVDIRQKIHFDAAKAIALAGFAAAALYVEADDERPGL